MTVSYNNILRTANKLYLSVSEAQVLSSIHYMNTFFKEAEGINTCVARMALQQGLVDTMETITDQYMNDEIDVFAYTEKNKNLVQVNKEIAFNKKLLELEKLIKSMYKKTGNMRLAIIPCMMDSSEYGLVPLKDADGTENRGFLYKIACLIIKRVNPAMLQSLEEDIAEDKSSKKLNFILRKFFIM